MSTEDVLEDMEPLDSYVIVEKDDVLEAIGTFVAAYLAELPQAQKLQPKELQTALRNAFKVRHVATGLLTASGICACKMPKVNVHRI